MPLLVSFYAIGVKRRVEGVQQLIRIKRESEGY